MKCPKCKSRMLEVNASSGNYLSCSNHACVTVLPLDWKEPFMSFRAIFTWKDRLSKVVEYPHSVRGLVRTIKGRVERPYTVEFVGDEPNCGGSVTKEKHLAAWKRDSMAATNRQTIWEEEPKYSCWDHCYAGSTPCPDCNDLKADSASGSLPCEKDDLEKIIDKANQATLDLMRRPFVAKRGSYYKQRNGTIVGPVTDIHTCGDFLINGTVYGKNGTFTMSGREHEKDLIEEVPNPTEPHPENKRHTCLCTNPSPSNSNLFLCYHCGGELYPTSAPKKETPMANPHLNSIGVKDEEVIAQGGVKFTTGAVRSSDKNHVMYQLISPIGMRRIAETMKEGFDKYGAYNWERGMPIGDILNHAIDHIYAYLANPNPDARSEDDLAHAAWNLFAAMHMEETHPNLDHGLRTTTAILPKPQGPTT